MIFLVIILILILAIAIYPVVRDAIRRRRVILPAYTEGLALLLEGNKDGAIEKFKQAVQRDSNNIDAYLRLGDLYFEKGDIERAIQIHQGLTLRQTLDKKQEKKIYQSLGHSYLRLARFAKAISIFEELIEIDSKNLSNYETLLMLYEKTERWEEASALLKKLARMQRDKTRISCYYAQLGRAISAKDPEQGMEYYRHALRLDRNCVPALLYQGDYFYARGETEAAIEDWKAILENSPKYNFLVRDRIETAYYDLGKYEEVIDVYKKLTDKIPDDLTLYTALARIYEKKEDTKSAIALLTKIPMSDQKEVLPQLSLALLQLKDGSSQKAEQTLDSLIEQLRTESYHFKCVNCGYESKELVWQCPECGTWESVRKY
ncbi:MAG: tetratricopeptide repeat protein [candidate division WOR-3 bacterium]|nr:tetratricopeptide repeat protein [candidate division WOR-3 bacterium]MDH5683303.1 tetratricopeptide repeat protein [candidate division WOR-3 bacterium]